MKNLLAIALFGALAWYGYGKYKASNVPASIPDMPMPASTPVVPGGVATTAASEKFSCDGRTHCSQMRSCAEATYFIQHCPGTRMDGNRDGVPCESQWCN